MSEKPHQKRNRLCMKVLDSVRDYENSERIEAIATALGVELAQLSVEEPDLCVRHFEATVKTLLQCLRPDRVHEAMVAAAKAMKAERADYEKC